VVPARPIGTLITTDRKGKDEKILAVPVGDPRFDDIVELSDLAKHWLLEIETFFATYKTLEGDDPSVSGWHGSRAAWKAIDAARKRARA
jgi:inorganic pyrophosphatase